MKLNSVSFGAKFAVGDDKLTQSRYDKLNKECRAALKEKLPKLLSSVGNPKDEILLTALEKPNTWDVNVYRAGTKDKISTQQHKKVDQSRLMRNSFAFALNITNAVYSKYSELFHKDADINFQNAFKSSNNKQHI